MIAPCPQRRVSRELQANAVGKRNAAGRQMPPRRIVLKPASECGHRLQQYDEYGEPVYCCRCEIDEPRLSSSAFWKARSGLTSYSDLQEDFFNKLSCKYGAVCGESKSLLKNTNAEQAQRAFFQSFSANSRIFSPRGLPFWKRYAVIVSTSRTGTISRSKRRINTNE